jgi:hypothetical protein
MIAPIEPTTKVERNARPLRVVAVNVIPGNLILRAFGDKFQAGV